MAKNPKSNESVLHYATSAKTSLRTTIPSFIKDQFELEKGDKLQWIIEEDHLIVRIVKVD